MRVFVAGATGAVGRPLLNQLKAAGHEVSALTRSAERGESARAAGAEPVMGDALDAPSLSVAVGAASPDVIVNQLTAIPDPIDPRKMEQLFEPTNRLRREGAANLMAAAREHGVRRVVAQSIAFAYAPTEPGTLWAEDDPLFTEAGEIVRAVESLEQQTLGTDGVEGVVLRYGFFYGPGTTYAADGGTAALVKKRRFPLVGKGTGVFSFIHVDDAAAATVAAIDTGPPGTYNIVDDDPAPLREYLPVLADALGAKKPYRVPKFIARLAAGPLAVRYATALQGASNEKAKRELGWKPRWGSWRQGFEEALG